jgi:hypothetical protein
MRRNWYLSLALAVTFALPDYDLAKAFPLSADTVGIAAPASEIIMARAVRGPRGGAAVRGPRGGAAVRGPRGGAAVRGPRGGVAVRGPGGRVAVGGAVVGRRYYGGTWYGTGRRYWGGRWWAYGVGRCWRATPIGYVWVCG